MKKPAKIILGIATLWPILFVAIFLLYGFFLPVVPQLREVGNVMFYIGAPTMLWVMALIILYFINVLKNDQIRGENKAWWVVLLFFTHIIAMPIYWYLYIWREPENTIEETSSNRV